MKINKYKMLGAALLLMLTAVFTSCESWIDPDINKDPNEPVTVEADLIMPGILYSMAYDMGGNDAVRTTGIWMQHFDGVDRQSFAEATFVYTPADCNNLWNSLYPNMINILDVIEQSSAVDGDGIMKSPKTKGVAEILLAESLAFGTNLWGDIPYTEALQGDANLSPVLDSQESIFTAIQALLDQAITDLQDETGAVDITSGDIVFNGDENAWLATAYGLKARYTLMLSERNGATALANAITYANQALTFATGSAFETLNGFVADIFLDSETGANPIYQFMDQRSGDLVMASTFMDFMAANSDPRAAVYGDGSGGGTGSVPTTQTGGVDLPGDYIAAIDAPIRFMNLSELYFILAEAQFTTDPATAITNAQTAINQSLAEAGVTTNGTFTAYVNGISTLEEIMMEKWVSTYGTVQPFNDWRRTNFPALTVPVNATNSQIPRRYPYPQEEVTYNTNVTGDATIFDHIWWDAN